MVQPDEVISRFEAEELGVQAQSPAGFLELHMQNDSMFVSF